MHIHPRTLIACAAGLVSLLAACSTNPATPTLPPATDQPATTSTDQPASGSTSDAPTASNGVSVGSCLIAGQNQLTHQATVVSCDQAHDSEVTLVFTAADPSDGKTSDATCKQAIIEYVGADYSDVGPNGLDYSWLLPTDMTASGPVVCTAYSKSQQPDLTGSVKGLG